MPASSLSLAVMDEWVMSAGCSINDSNTAEAFSQGEQFQALEKQNRLLLPSDNFKRDHAPKTTGLTKPNFILRVTFQSG